MSHGHHHHVDPDSGDGKIALAVAINLGLTVAQVIGGIVAGSLSLIADALHNFSDAIALIIAFAARKIARRPANADMTFGYGRIEAVAALINYTTLIVIGLYLGYEAAMRFANPEPVAGWIVVIVAGFALLAVQFGLLVAFYNLRMRRRARKRVSSACDVELAEWSDHLHERRGGRDVFVPPETIARVIRTDRHVFVDAPDDVVIIPASAFETENDMAAFAESWEEASLDPMGQIYGAKGGENR